VGTGIEVGILAAMGVGIRAGVVGASSDATVCSTWWIVLPKVPGG